MKPFVSSQLEKDEALGAHAAKVTSCEEWTQWELEQANLLYVVHGSDRSIGLGVLSEADETETTATSSVTVLNDDLKEEVMLVHNYDPGAIFSYSFFNLTVLLELGTESCVVRVPCKAAVE